MSGERCRSCWRASPILPHRLWRSVFLRRTHPGAHSIRNTSALRFPGHLEALARRAAGQAEWAHARLSEHFVHGPEGPIDIILTDHTDVSNGYATPFPSNRIVLFARPPVDSFPTRLLRQLAATLDRSRTDTRFFTSTGQADTAFGDYSAGFRRRFSVFPP